MFSPQRQIQEDTILKDKMFSKEKGTRSITA